MSPLYKNKNLGGGYNLPLLIKRKINALHGIGMIPIILALVIGATITVPITGWILSLNQNIGETNAKLEASTVSTEEWNRLGHMSLDELRAQKETLKEPYPVGNYKVMVNLGEEGYFSDGKCGAIPSGRVANCFDDTTITVFNSDGDRQFNSRQLPLQVGIYTKEEIDELLNSLLDGISMKYDPNEKTIKYYKDGAEIESGSSGARYEDAFYLRRSSEIFSFINQHIDRVYYLGKTNIEISRVTLYSSSNSFSTTYAGHSIYSGEWNSCIYIDGNAITCGGNINHYVLARGKA